MNYLFDSIINTYNNYFVNLIYLIKFSIIISCYFNINNYQSTIILDNEFPSLQYENNINFSNYSTDIKPIAIFNPEFIDFNYSNISFNNDFDYKININQNLFYHNLKEKKIKTLKNKIELAKSHGIYGFAIRFFFDFNDRYKDINLFINNSEIEFPFFLIWENNNFNNLYNSISKNVKTKKKIISNIFLEFVNSIQDFMKFKLYIKFNDKPILAIENPLIFDNEKLLILRSIFKNKGFGEIFIICSLKNYNLLNRTNNYDSIYDLPKYEIRNNISIKFPISYYSGVIYRTVHLNTMSTENFLFRTSLIETNFILKKNILKYYSTEKFYILNKVIIKWVRNNFKRTNGIFFLSSWNDYRKGNYLEPDRIYGYASLNTFSKALFNLPFNEKDYSFLYSNNICNIAIQAHVFYEDLINEIINKTNNIPFKFDFFITTISSIKKSYIDENIRRYSKANNYEIKIVQNRGRDVLPFIVQMRDSFKKYKYICHLHTKKTQKYPIVGNMWRNFLYNNLLGNKEIISEIIYDFEKNYNLGFIFPDVYYNTIKGIKNFESINFKYHKENIYYINFVMKKLFGKTKIGNKLIFPSGDMFWAKIDSIHQIFEINFIKRFPKEKGQLNKTVMHAIERIWLYLVKLNGYYYKAIFKKY